MRVDLKKHIKSGEFYRWFYDYLCIDDNKKYSIYKPYKANIDVIFVRVQDEFIKKFCNLTKEDFYTADSNSYIRKKPILGLPHRPYEVYPKNSIWRLKRNNKKTSLPKELKLYELAINCTNGHENNIFVIGLDYSHGYLPNPILFSLELFNNLYRKI